ncbi:pleckstrin homology domain-containing family H member 1-like isoform X2 [Acanthaster planci]|uniref:Pleckstrin homology domain-containing family H member 1-like isoform X2 n=1 Tax=Acanthaster planci TaxID=133434 RepID=A0A8B7YD76_ACAPL|nr:pleckstrin homology domain-containing family H member 1-like isoform X2 [Acanthaster planci]
MATSISNGGTTHDILSHLTDIDVTKNTKGAKDEAKEEGAEEEEAEGVDWKERYILLEEQLDKFRLQATKIRAVLGERMEDLEEKVKESNTRAEMAEKEVKEVTEKLASMRRGSGESERSQALNKRIQALEAACQEKEDVIRHLEKQLTEQRELRLEDSRLVDTKITQIKEWVATTVTQLEEENRCLRAENVLLSTGRESLEEGTDQEPSQKPSPPRPTSVLSEPPEIPARPTSSSIREHLQSILDESRSAGDAPRRPKPPARNRKSPDESHVSALIQVHEEFIKQGEERPLRDETFKCAACERRMKLQDSWMVVREEVSNNTWPRRQPHHAHDLTKQHSYDEHGPTVSNITCEPEPRRDLIVHCEFCGHDGVPVHVESDEEEPTPGMLSSDQLLGSQASLMSLSDSSLALQAPPPTPASPGTGGAKSLAHSLIQANDNPTITNNNNDSPSSDAVKLPGTLEALADSVSATAKVLHQSSNRNNNQTPSFSEAMVDHTLDSLEDAAQSQMDTETTAEDDDDEVFLKDGFVPESRNSDYADLFQEEIESRPPKKSESKYQSLTSFNTTVVLGKDDDDYDEPPDDFFSMDSPEESVKPDMKMVEKSNPTPPPPPLHKMPPWENRIYTIADRGMTLSSCINNMASPSKTCPAPICQSWEGSSTAAMYKDMSVPVYTTLRGHADQIRSTPFSGDSSDSSDEEHCLGGGGKLSQHIQSAVGTLGRRPSPSASPAKSGSKIGGSGGGGGGSALASGSPSRKLIGIGGTPSTPMLGLKRGVSAQSGSSEADYAIPPDAISCSDSTNSDEPEPKLLKTCAAFTAENVRKGPLEKSGWLTKFGGRMKSWKRRWFVLRDGELCYYKSMNESSRKPRGRIPLDTLTKISRSEGSLTFELVTTKRTYYLTAGSSAVMEEWITVLNNVLCRYNTRAMMDKGSSSEEVKPSIQSWLTKVKNGHSKTCWCVLAVKTFSYYKKQGDKVPIGTIDIGEASVEEVDQSQNSDDEGDGKTESKYSLCLAPAKKPDKPNPSPTYLVFNSKEEKDNWLYHLLVASGGGNSDAGTEFEKLISRLMVAEGNPQSPYWKHPMLCYSKESIEKPLTTLPSEPLKKEAVKLGKSCNLFITVQMDTLAIDYHISLAQNALQTCLSHPELQNEMYCQLIKQTTRCPPGSGTASLQVNPQEIYLVTQAWQLLAMCCVLFLPQQKYLWFLKAHLRRHADTKNDVGKYALFCQRSLERTIHKGGREAKPSRQEVLSILQRHPYHHSFPISMPIHFMNGSYQVVGFDGSTTVKDLLHTLNHKINMRDSEESGFALFTDDPCGREIEHCLHPSAKICDVISKWEQTLKETQTGKWETARMVRLTYKNRLYFRQRTKRETERERLLLAYQVNDDIINGWFPINKELALELAALMAQIEYNDYRPSVTNLELPSAGTSAASTSQTLDSAFEKFYPKRYKSCDEEELRTLKHNLAQKWCVLKGRTPIDCVRIYLTVTRKWPLFGAKLFPAKCKFGKQERVWLAVQDSGVSMLNYQTLQELSKYSFQSMVTFGGCRDDFMIVLSQSVTKEVPREREHGTEKLLFAMTKTKVLEITLLIASYINAIVKQEGLTYKPSGEAATADGMASSGSGGPAPCTNPKVWDLESSTGPIVVGGSRIV